MKYPTWSWFTTFAVVSCLFASFVPTHAQPPVLQQTFNLRPGWNAIWLDVDPVDPTDLRAIFAGLPITSVWRWHQPENRIQFIDEPSNGLWNKAGWKVFVPDGAATVANNLFALRAQRGYLIELGGTQPVTLTISGTVGTKPPKWVARSYNLRGFLVNPNSPPSFRQLLQHDPALAGQSVRRLLSDGRWIEVDPNTPVQAGQAYWIYAKRTTRFAGTLNVTSAEINFGPDASYQDLSLQTTHESQSVQLEWPANDAPLPLKVRQFDADSGLYVWRPFTQMRWPLNTNRQLTLNLGLARAQLAAGHGSAVLQVADGSGCLAWIPVTLTRDLSEQKNGATPFTGLWLGQAVVNQVAYQSAETGQNELQAVSRPLTYRLILHVDQAGRIRFLKHVIQMWRRPQTRVVEDPIDPGNERLEVLQPGAAVLLTDDTLVDQWTSAGLSDNERLGYRISAVAFDFDPVADEPPETHPLLGQFGVAGARVYGSLRLGATHPTNPFYHLYHPDHDQRDPHRFAYPDDGTGKPTVAESFTIVRDLELMFADEHPENNPTPEWGVSELGGVYRETVSGLKKAPVVMEGYFELRRLDTIGELNPEANQTEVMTR